MASYDLLPPVARTIPALLRSRAEQCGDRVLFRWADSERSYSQMVDIVARTAGTLAVAGIERGDRVALMSENRAELLDYILGCAWLGAVAVPLNTALRGPGLEHQLLHSGARLLIVEGDLAPVLDVITRPAALERIWLLGGAGDHSSKYDKAPLSVGGTAIEPALVGPGDFAALLYTSGTTGPAKGVRCPHAQFYWWGVNVGDQLEIGPDDVLYTCLPIFHINALGAFFQALVAGATFHLGPRFSASAMLDRLAESGATVTYLLGAMITILENKPPAPEDSAHRVTRALAPSTTATQHVTWLSRFGIELVDSYGSTETNAVLGAPLGNQRPGHMGPVRAGFHAKVVDELDNELPPGVVGELVIRAEDPFALSDGYFQASDKTVEAWRNLWFHTGDLVETSHDGFFQFRDRLKDAIRRRGENISSFDVEAALRSHPAVRHVAAYALPSELSEDEVAVAVVAEADAPSPEELVRWCESRLAYFAIPRFIRFVSQLPVTENGKVRKAELREQGTHACWDREVAGVRVSRRAPAL